MEMMDDMLERADFEGAPYKREPFAGEGGQYAEDQPMEELSPAQAQVLFSASRSLIVSLRETQIIVLTIRISSIYAGTTGALLILCLILCSPRRTGAEY